MSRAGYAEFFPNAPSVVLAKKAEAERVAREKARKAHEGYERDASGARSAASTTSSAASALTANSQLTPATSSSSPPDVSPRSVAKEKAPPPETSNDQVRPAIPTPKATPPAVAKPAERNCRIKYDPFLDKDASAKKSKQPIYRYDGEGVRICIFHFCDSGSAVEVWQ
jgi:histone-lysine N-methyltransferase SETD1